MAFKFLPTFVFSIFAVSSSFIFLQLSIMEHGIEAISLRSVAMVSGEFDDRPSRDEHTPEDISESEYRSDCNNIPGSFYKL